MAVPAEEAEDLCEAVREFQKHHEIPVLSEKRLSEVMLASAVLSIAAPRVMLFFAKPAPAAPAMPQTTAGPIAPSEPAAAWFPLADDDTGARPH